MCIRHSQSHTRPLKLTYDSSAGVSDSAWLSVPILIGA